MGEVTVYSVDVDASLDGIMSGLQKTVGDVALAATQAVADKYRTMFEDLNEAAKHSAETQDLIIQFARKFQPMNSDAFNYVLQLKVFAQTMKQDKIPTIEDCLETDIPDVEAVSDVVQEIVEAFEPLVELFDKVQAGYATLLDEAQALDLQAQKQIVNSESQASTAETALAIGIGAVAVSGAGAGVGIVVLWSGSLAAACMGPVGWSLLLGVGAVGGTITAIASHEAKTTHHQIVASMAKVDKVMREITQLVYRHRNELQDICASLKKLADDSKTLDKSLCQWKDKQGEGKSTKVPCGRAKRQLGVMRDDCTVLEKKCDTYIETEKGARIGLLNIVGGR